MNVSPNALRKETVVVLKQVDEALKKPEGDDWSTLLLAKSMCLNTLTLLNEPTHAQRRRER